MLLIFILLMISGCAIESQIIANNTIKVDGSSTVYPIVENVSQSFIAKYPINNIELSYSGSGTGIRKLINGQIDIALSSREINEFEFEEGRKRNVSLFMTAIANDYVVFHLNENNPIKDIKQEDLKKIYNGEIKDWSYFNTSFEGEIMIYSSSIKTSGTAAFVYDSLNVKQSNLKNMFYVEHTSQIIEKIKNDQNGIGFSSSKSIIEGVSELRINGINVREEELLKTEYPFVRSLFIVTDGAATGNHLNFVNFLLSMDIQNHIEKMGYVKVS